MRIITSDIKSPEDALVFLAKLGANEILIKHHELVLEAAVEVSKILSTIGIKYDKDIFLIGAAIHDCGKILFPKEITEGGKLHELAGQKLLLENGVDNKIARMCFSHGNWDKVECSIDDYLCALADSLWKGTRIEKLEAIIVEMVSKSIGKDFWDIFIELDTCFEKIADGGANRLLRSRVDRT